MIANILGNLINNQVFVKQAIQTSMKHERQKLICLNQCISTDHSCDAANVKPLPQWCAGHFHTERVTDENTGRISFS